MWQWFLRAVQIAVFGFFVIGDLIDNYTEGRPAFAILYGGLFAFAITQALVGLKWLFVDRKRGTNAQ